MKILKATQVKEADNYTIKHKPISSINLMEQAATMCSNWIVDKFIFNIYETNKHFKIFVGPGNNGGDGLVIARLINQEVGRWFYKNSTVDIYILNFTDNFSPDFLINLERLKKTTKNIFEIKSEKGFPIINKEDIIIDAIFGSGLSRVAKGLPAKVINFINQSDNNKVVAIDIPSGLFGEENHKTKNQTIIKANYTLTFEFPFLSFFFQENQDYVGDFFVIPIGIHASYVEKVETNYFTTEKENIIGKIKKREKFSHKGDYGHGLLIAGQKEKLGASILAVKAAHRAGIGRLTVYSEDSIALNITSPESMITQNLDFETYSAIAIGQGFGLDADAENLLKNLLENSQKPLVVDADAITIIGKNKNLLANLQKHIIFTPHPKEFERLVGKSKNNYQRNLKQIKFSSTKKVYIILKGAHTAITTPEGNCYFNTTGNPGMATGGSGDSLTGILLSLLAQGYSEDQACILGVYLHGLAADIALETFGSHSLMPSDIINNIHLAIKNSC